MSGTSRKELMSLGNLGFLSTSTAAKPWYVARSGRNPLNLKYPWAKDLSEARRGMLGFIEKHGSGNVYCYTQPFWLHVPCTEVLRRCAA